MFSFVRNFVNVSIIMERSIAFCVLIFHLGLVASFPFPEPYNLEYQQPQLQYSNFAQSRAPSIGQPRQQYGNVVSYQSGQSYPKLQYPSAVSNSALQDLINRESVAQRGQTYGNYISQQPLAPQVQTQQQIEDEIQEQIKQHVANQIRKQAAQNLQSVPVSNTYQNVRNYENDPSVSQVAPLYIPIQQQLPRENAPTQWSQTPSPPQIQYENDSAATTQEQESKIDPFRQIYQHLANQQYNGFNKPVQWKNLWKKYGDTQPPKHKKRYLVIHPDGRTEYVDQIETLAQKHPNYLLVNGGSFASNKAPTATNPQTFSPYANTNSQTNFSGGVPVNIPLTAPYSPNFNQTTSPLTATPSPPSTTSTPSPTPDPLLGSNIIPVPTTTPVTPTTALVLNTTLAPVLPTSSSIPTSTPPAPTPTTTETPSTTPPPSTTAGPILPGYAASPTLPSPTTTTVPPSTTATNPPSPTSTESSPLASNSTASSNSTINPTTPAPVTNSTSVIPSTTNDSGSPLDLSKINAGPPTVIEEANSDILKQLVGNDSGAVYFFLVQPQPVIEKDIKTTIYPNGTMLEEVTQTVNGTDGTPKVTKTVRLIPPSQ